MTVSSDISLVRLWCNWEEHAHMTYKLVWLITISSRAALICMLDIWACCFCLRCVYVFVSSGIKLQALVYDILPSTTAIFSYAIGSWKLSANDQFFVGAAQTVVILLQTTQIISDICFITDHVAYASSDKAKIVCTETELFFFLPRVDAPHVYMCAWALGCFYSHFSTQTFWRALTASVDTCAEIKSVPSVV